MPAHTYNNRVDAVIVGRGCDPFYMAPDGSCVYKLSDDSLGAGPYISTWSPPDASYGDTPTAAEIAAVSDAAAEAEASAAKQLNAQARLDTDVMALAMLDAIASATSIDADDLKADVVARLL
jgi:hypothetical protein